MFFSGNWEELSTPLKVPPVKLQLKDENKPIICKYRRQSPEKMKVLEEMIGNLMKAKMVARSSGRNCYVSNPHIVFEERRVNDTLVRKNRCTIDYRNLNNIIKSESYP